MSDKRGAGGALIFAAIVLAILLPILYVISNGPAAWLESKGYLSPATIGVFYSPLNYLCQHSDPLLRFVVWWQDLFLPTDSGL